MKPQFHFPLVLTAFGLLSATNSFSQVTSFPFGSDWEWFHPLDGIGDDPAIADPDFNDTWHNPVALGYDGPQFNPAAPGSFGYGAITFFNPLTTFIGQPISGNRFTAYFRREFNLAEEIESAVVEFLADDGAVIYLDGVEVARANFTGLDIFTALSTAVDYWDGEAD